MTRSLQIQRYVIAIAVVIGLTTALAKSLGDLGKSGIDPTVTASPLPVPLDSQRPLHPWKELNPTTRTGGVPGIVASLGLMLVTGYFAGSLLLGVSGTPLVHLFLAALSVPLGFALHSSAAFALMLCGRLDHSTLIMSVPYVNGMMVGTWLILRSRSPIHSLNPPEASRLQVRELVAVIVLLLACCAGPIIKRLGGDWDALYFWNARAASILCAGHDWRWAYDGTIDPAYNDYPLCLPLTIAIGWSYAGQMTFVVPLVISILSLLSIVLILYASAGLIAVQYSRWHSISAVLIFLSLPALGRVVAGQRADLLFSAAMLGAASALILAHVKGEDRYLRLCVPLAACAAWIKNEGLVLAALIFLLMTWVVVTKRLSLKSLLPASILFACPIVLAILALKLSISHSNDLWTFQTTSAPTEGDVLQRALTIMGAFAKRISGYLYLPYLAVVAVCVLNLRTAWIKSRYLLLILVGMASAYLIVFLITPRDLEWHLEHSEKRLLVHLWPLWILLLQVIFANVQSGQAPQSASRAATKD